MNIKQSCLFFLFFTTILSAQKLEYSSSFIPDSLKQNANAVVRLDQIDIVVLSQQKMTIKNKRVVTVLNEKGLGSIDAIEHYDKQTSVRSIDATVFDGFGNEIKKIKRKDFRDQCAIDGITLFSDSRLIYLNYTPTQYPFTIDYESEVETSNTATIQEWIPLNYNFLSIEKSILNVSFTEDLGFKKKEFNFAEFKIKKTKETSTQLSYTATNIIAQKPEDYSPIYAGFPRLMMSLEKFNLEGVDGTSKNWNEFGKWYSDKILNGTIELSDETKAKMKALVGDEKDPIKKAKLIYNYVQEKSRYVSIQVGIGGWKPMYANDVDRLGYGDCKALSNYTKALLNVVDVPSYNTLLYGGPNKIGLESDFMFLEVNHMILCIPNKDEYIFLECTSQDDPFGYQANFTDDRNVVVMKPDGGEIIRTKNYENKDNSQISKGNYSLAENGDFLGKIAIVSEGSQYGRKFHLETTPPIENDKHYKNYWNNINNLKINKTTFLNDKEKISFTENVDVSATNYGTISNNKMIFVVNSYNQTSDSVKRIRNRKNPFEIDRGYYESMPSNFELNSKFGEYKTEIIKKENNNLIYKRSIFIKKGLYKNTEYDEYRLYIEQISKNDNAKIILTKN
jgi:transglutaminase-like putative cysteine protease